jgi:N6-adenosine-specific RNA methylase IME4
MGEVRVKRPDPVKRPDSVRFLPGNATTTGWLVPEDITREEWVRCGKRLKIVEGAIQWWFGDWWAFGGNRPWGDGQKIAEAIGVDYGQVRNFGSVARAFDLSERSDKLTFVHHSFAMAAPPERRVAWLKRAEENDWSANKFKSEIARAAAIGRTMDVEFDAANLGKFVVLYADPPWQYENPPMGGTNRSIENHYPTMTLEEICAMPVGEIAHENAVLFMWATSPKLAECMQVLTAWGFTHRTTMAWVKDKIGMGYHVRERHEIVLIAKRGELPPPDEANRPDSVFEAPRLEHSAKPPITYDLIDRMYPGIRKPGNGKVSSLDSMKKAAKFRAIGTKRVNSALKIIGRIGNLSNRQAYAYSDSDIKKLVGSLLTAVDRLEARFTPSAKESEFSF